MDDIGTNLLSKQHQPLPPNSIFQWRSIQIANSSKMTTLKVNGLKSMSLKGSSDKN